jgi:hypothetical protein
MRFEGRVRKVGAWYVVDVPAAVSRAIGKRGHVPIIGTVDGVEVRQSLMPLQKGKHSLTLKKAIRDRLGLSAGARVTVTFELDDAPPVDPIPPDLAFALRDEDALAAFEKMSRSQRNALLRWIEEAATEATREKRIAKTLERALAVRETLLDRGEARGRARSR